MISPTAPPAAAWPPTVPFWFGEASSVGGAASAPEYQPPSSGRPKPSASLRSSTGNLISLSSQRSGSRTYSGYTVNRGARANPLASVTARRRSRAGQGRSGFTWSAVTGDTPPQSSMPASSSTPKSSDRLGGAWTWISSGRMRRARAMASRYWSWSQGGAACMAVPGLGRKFWTMTSCTWPQRRWDSAMASSASTRSARVSPMPTRMPVVNGMASSPAASRVASRRSGVLSGDPRWQSRSASVSSIIPCEGAALRSRASSSGYSAPALAWGSSPVFSATSRAAWAR